MRLDDLRKKLVDIKNLGFVNSQRVSSTGIGYTFEKLLGITENNIPIPDLGGTVEVKTTRRGSSSLITLFTFNRGAWKIDQRELIEKFGYPDSKGRKGFKKTFYMSSNEEIKLRLDNNSIKLVYQDKVLAEWDLYSIVGKFLSKLGVVLFVIADRIYDQGIEKFHYNEAYILKNSSSYNFIEAIKNNYIAVDVRMHLKESGAVRNHGTAVRIIEKHLPILYETKQKIL